MPGSMEEDLAAPDSFFDPRERSPAAHLLPVLPRVQPSWKRLAPVDVFAKAEEMYRTHVRFADEESTQRSVAPKGRKASSRDPSRDKKPKKRPTCVDVEDERLRDRYVEIGTRLAQTQTSQQSIFGSTGSLATMTMTTGAMRNSRAFQDPRPARQERFFETHDEEQRRWNRFLNRTCKDLGRRPSDSVVVRADGYRERVEKSHAMEMANPTAIIYGVQGWYLSLRHSPKFRDTKHYALPVGKDFNGLWAQITDNPHAQETVVRNPVRMPQKHREYKDNPFVIAKQKLEAKRLSEIIPVNDVALDGLLVVGRDAYREEMKGFERCGKPKVVEPESEHMEELFEGEECLL